MGDVGDRTGYGMDTFVSYFYSASTPSRTGEGSGGNEGKVVVVVGKMR